MCGIAGIVSLNKSGNYNSEIDEALSCLKHRGPDDSGKEMFITSTGYVYLGQTRLSIIDLSSGGHQPMFSNDGRYVVVFNGEIYNYRELRLELTNFGYHFKTDSDTEVLLAGWTIWNVNCLKRFIGMFSFAILDIQTECLFIVRDAFGIKPLYYCYKDERVFFASEIPAILKFMPQRPSINLQTAYD